MTILETLKKQLARITGQRAPARRRNSRPYQLETLERREVMTVNIGSAVAQTVTMPETLGLQESFQDEFASLDQIPNRTFIVTTNLDTIKNDGKTSLREAVMAANASPGLDRITFASSLNGKKITLQDRAFGALKVTDDLLIEGFADNPRTRADERVTIDGSGADGFGTRIFDVDDGSLDKTTSVGMSNLILANGWTRAKEGAGILNMENIRLANVKMTGNRALWQTTYARNETALDWSPVGGAIANYGNLHVINGEVTGNTTANGHAGAIFNEGNMLIENSTITRNQTTGRGGAIANTETGQLEIHNSRLRENVSSGSGGAIHNLGTVAIVGTAIEANATRGDLGGGGLANFGDASVTASAFRLNKVQGVGAGGVSDGGAAVYSTGNLQVRSSLFEKNAVNVPTLTERNQAGGAVQIEGGNAHFDNVLFFYNKARNGGAIFVDQGYVTVKNSAFERNESIRPGSGSGIAVQIEGPAISTNRGDIIVDAASRFLNNRLNRYGSSNVANNLYKRSQRSLDFDPAVQPTLPRPVTV